MNSEFTNNIMDNKNSSFDFGGLGTEAQTPDSGIDIAKFNIVDYILDADPAWDSNLVVMSDATENHEIHSNNPSAGNETKPIIQQQHQPQATQPQQTTTSFVMSQTQSIPAKNSLPPLRIASRQELMRRKALEEQKRERDARACVQQPPPQSTPVDLPNPLSTSPQVKVVPKELLTVETRLENPTRYHLQQCVRNNITRFAMENNNQKGGSVPPPATFNVGGGIEHLQAVNQLRLQALQPQPGSAPPNMFAPDHHSPLPSMTSQVPTSMTSSVGTSVTSGCSDLNDPLTALEVDSEELNMFSLSEINEIITQDESDSVFSYGATTNAGFVSSPQTPTSSSAPHKSQTSKTPLTASSTPVHSPGTPEADMRAQKDRQKKDNHNKIERRRRYLINDMITLQGQQLPKPNEPYYEKFGDVKQNKGAILQASVDYIQILKDENETYRKRESKMQLKIQQTEQEKKKLLLRIQELEQLCRSNGVTIPEENLTWRPQQPDKISSLINEPIVIKQEPRFMELMDEGGSGMVTGSGDPMLGSVDDFIPIDDVGMELS